MTDFTTSVHVTGNTHQMDEDLPFLQTIVQAAYDSHAMIIRDWVNVAASRKASGIKDEDLDWAAIFEENIEAIQMADLVIVEATQCRFGQGYQAYLAMQYKKPTLVVTRTKPGVADKFDFITGIEGRLATVKQYKTQADLKEIVEKFIKQNAIPERDLRFNMFLDRRIYKYLRDEAYETGQNKSKIVRRILQRAIEERNKQ